MANDWLRILNNKGFYTGGEIRGGKIRADGDVSVTGSDAIQAGCGALGDIFTGGPVASLSGCGGSAKGDDVAERAKTLDDDSGDVAEDGLIDS